MVWSDGRMGGRLDQIFAARLDRSGNPLDPLGLPLDIFANPYAFFWNPHALLWNGQHFVLISSPNGLGIWDITRIDTSGKVVSRDKLETGPGWSVSSTRSGNNARVLFVRGNGDRKVRIFDGNLNPIGPDADLAGPEFDLFLASTVLGDDEFLVFRITDQRIQCNLPNGCQQIIGTRFDSSGRILSSQITPAPGVDSRSLVALAEGDDGYLILHQEPFTGAVRSFALNRSGVWNGTNTILYTGDLHYNTQRPPPGLIFDGEKYIAAWVVSLAGGMSEIRTAEIAENGTLIRTAPLTSNIPLTSHLALGRNGGRQTVIAGTWSDGSRFDLFAHTFSSGAQPALQSTLLSASARTQLEPATAASNRGYAVVWLELHSGVPQDLMIRRFDPSGHPVGDPELVASFPYWSEYVFPAFGVVSSGETFLIVWQEERNLKGRRMTASGQWLDEEAFVIQPTHTEFDRQGLGSNGRDFLVTWTDPSNDAYKAFVRPIPAAGPLLGESAPLAEGRDQHQPAVAWNGSEYFIVWSDGFRHCQYFCEYPPFDVRGTRLGSDGQPVGASPLILVDQDRGHPEVPSIIWDGSRYLVAYSRGLGPESEIRGIRVAADGTVLEAGTAGGAILRSPAYNLIGQLVRTADGAVLLTQRGSANDSRDPSVTILEGTLIHSDLPLTDAGSLTPFPIATEGIPGYVYEFYSISGASRGGQLLLTYSRARDPQTYGGVRRVWLRLFGTPDTPRRRAVRR